MTDKLLMISEVEIMKTMTSLSDYKQFYYINNINSTSICKMCLKKFAYNQQITGTSTMKRHLSGKHLNVYNMKDSIGAVATRNQSTLFDYVMKIKQNTKPKEEISKVTQCALTLCRARHILPLQFFEDPIICQGFKLEIISRRTVRNEIQRIARNLSNDIFEFKRGQWASLVLDGWKNTTTNEKHISLILFFCDEPKKPVFVKSHVLDKANADTICAIVLEILSFLDQFNIIVIAAVTDNAPNMIAAMKLVSKNRPTLMPLRCASHICNLILKDFFKDVNFLSNAFEILKRNIDVGTISRYVATRWNSVYDKLEELLKILKVDLRNKDDTDKLEAAVIALKPLIDVLNLTQTDGMDWCTTYKSIESMLHIYEDTGRDSMVSIIKRRLQLIENPLVKLIRFVEQNSELDDDTCAELNNWFNALKLFEFEEFLADYILCGTRRIPRKFELFYKYKLPRIAVSEASVERCFGIHKRIHTPLRASLTNDIVEDILFIRYNYSIEETLPEDCNSEDYALHAAPLFDD